MEAIPIWIRGALVCLFGSTLTALGLVLQKHSHAKAAEAELSSKGDAKQGEDLDAGKSYWTQPWWLLGFLIFLAAQLINMASMAMAPQAVLSCLGSWTLVCNTIFARVLLGEIVSTLQVVAVCGLVVSAASVIYTAPRPTESQDSMFTTVTFLADRFASPEFECLTAFLLMFAGFTRVLASGAPLPGDCRQDDSTAKEALRPSTASARQSALVQKQSSATPLLSPRSPSAEEALRKAAILAHRSLGAFSWATAAAIAAGYTALLFKCVAEMLAGAGAAVAGQGILAQSPWMRWQSYAIAAAALSCAPAELHFLNLALQDGEAGSVVPMYLSLGMIAQLLTGVVFFEEYEDFSTKWHAAEFGFSVSLTLTFVVLMAHAQTCKARNSVTPDSLPPVPEVEEERANEEPQPDMGKTASQMPAARCVSEGGLSFGKAETCPESPLPSRWSIADNFFTGVSPARRRLTTKDGLTRPRLVTVAGFGGAIESLDACSRQGRTRSRTTSEDRSESAPGRLSFDLSH